MANLPTCQICDGAADYGGLREEIRATHPKCGGCGILVGAAHYAAAVNERGLCEWCAANRERFTQRWGGERCCLCKGAFAMESGKRPFYPVDHPNGKAIHVMCLVGSLDLGEEYFKRLDKANKRRKAQGKPPIDHYKPLYVVGP